ncbi:MAG: sterol carrier family protein [Nocardioidaceae bacterium]
MPVRLRPLPADELGAVLERLDSAETGGRSGAPDDVRAAVKHFLAVLTERAPGKSVEVRVPPYAAVQCIDGARHTRGTPPAVVETDGATWLALARGRTTFAEARHAGRVRASGERSDLSALLPLV